MKKILLTLVVAALAGCASVKPVPLEPVVVTNTQYVIKIPPAELMTLPAPVPPINVDTAKQSDVAKWTIANEAYVNALKNQLTQIANFFVTQQAQLNSQASTQNVAATAAANAADANLQKQVDATKVDLNEVPPTK